MLTFRFAAVVGAVLLAVSASSIPVALGAPQAAVDPAVAAYVAKQQAAQDAALDAAAAARATALLADRASPVIGNPKGDVTIVEFFDYTCPYCKAIEPRLEQLLKTDKNVRLVLKEYPILTPESLVASRAALAATKQGKYEVFHNTLMNFRGRLTNEVIFDTAKTVGLDMVRLRKDMDAPETSDQIIAVFNLARGMRVFQTPTFLIGTDVRTEPSAELDFPKLVAAARAKK
jgi:protein-disulfide isomerase